MTQAESIIRKFGGAIELARALGYNKSTVYRWTYPREKYGTEGRIPLQAQEDIKALARREGIVLTARDWHPDEFDD